MLPSTPLRSKCAPLAHSRFKLNTLCFSTFPSPNDHTSGNVFRISHLPAVYSRHIFTEIDKRFVSGYDLICFGGSYSAAARQKRTRTPSRKRAGPSRLWNVRLQMKRRWPAVVTPSRVGLLAGCRGWGQGWGQGWGGFYAWARAWSRSAMMSSAFSMPTDRRMRSSER